MTAATLIAEIEQGKIRSFYFLHGAEQFFHTEILNALTRQLITEDNRDFNLETFDAKSSSVNDWITATKTLSFLGGTKLVVVRHLHEAALDAKEAQPLLDTIAELPGDVCLVLTADKADRKKKLFKSLTASKGAVECEAPKEAALIPWVRKRARSMGYTLAVNAARTLVDRVGARPGLLATELEKLLTYCGKNKNVSEADVAAVVGDIRMENPFALTDALKIKDAEKALHLLHNQLDHGEDPLKLMGAIAWQFRMIWEVKHYQSKNWPQDKIAAQMGARPFLIEKAMRHTGNFDRECLVKSFESLSRADRELKTTGNDKEGILETLILNLCAGKK